MNKKYFIFIIFIMSLIIGFVSVKKASAQFVGGVLVYPNVIEMEFPDSSKTFATKVIQVENPTDKPFRVRAYIQSWSLNSYGSILFSDKPEKFSLNDYLKFNPKEFDLAPGQKQVVRIASKLPQGIDGEYRSIIFFETVNPKQDILGQTKDKININVSFKTRYGVAVYAYKGNVSRQVELQDLKYEKAANASFINATLKNNGNIHCNLEGELSLVPSEGSNPVTIALSKYTTLPGNTQKFRIQLPDNLPSNGSYSALIRLNYKNTEGIPQILEGKTSFDYKSKAAYTKKDLKKTTADEENINKTQDNVAKPVSFEKKYTPVELNTEIQLKK